MAMPGPDPNFVKEQQQILRMLGLKRARKAESEAKGVSANKLLLILVPVFLLALAVILYTSGAFDKGRTVSWNGAVYRLPRDIYSVRVETKPEGFKFAGYLDPEENASDDWRPTGEVYVKEGSDRVIYLYLYPPNGYYRAKKQ